MGSWYVTLADTLGGCLYIAGSFAMASVISLVISWGRDMLMTEKANLTQRTRVIVTTPADIGD
jgi:ribosome biogenesis protein Tsr3